MGTRYTADVIESMINDGLPDATEFVTAADYDAITAERDELKRRIDAIIARLAPGDLLPSSFAPVWAEREKLHRAALAIAEGRDNG